MTGSMVIREEKGSSLLELVVAMPLLTALLVAIGGIMCFGIRSYVFSQSDYELQEQVRIPLERIVRDLSNAEDVKISGSTLAIKCRETDELLWTSYYLTDTGKVEPKIMRSWKNSPQPLTGETSIGKIRITKFAYKVNGKTVYVEISARNYLTQREYTLHTAVTLPEKEAG